MSTQEAQQEWEYAERHPELPGENLDCFELDGATCMYDQENPQAYIIGDPVEVGTGQ